MENDVIAEKVQPVVKKVRKPRSKVNKAEVRFYLPDSMKADGSVNATLRATSGSKFKTFLIVPTSQKADAPGKNVLTDASLGHLSKFLIALLDAWTSGTGLGSDGSSLYILENWEKVKSALPAVAERDLVFSTSQSGAASYRIPITTLVTQVLARAKTVQACISKYGASKVRHTTSKETNAPAVEL